MDPARQLRPAQVDLVRRWFPDHRVVADHTWPGQTSVVLELLTEDGDHVIVKASTGAAFDHHLDRELRAHRLVGRDLGTGFPVLIAADDDERILVTRHLPGHIAQGTDWEWHPGVHRAAGELLTRFQQAGPSTRAAQLGDELRERGTAGLDGARDLITPVAWSAAAALLEQTVSITAALVPTHGDFQPRNWLVDPDRPDDDGTPAVALIDFGRFDLRPWYSDLVRLHHRVTPTRPDLRDALLDGMGRDTGTPVGPEDLDGWRLENLVQAISTIVWATAMGFDDFADHGRDMLVRTLDEWTS